MDTRGGFPHASAHRCCAPEAFTLFNVAASAVRVHTFVYTVNTLLFEKSFCARKANRNTQRYFSTGNTKVPSSCQEIYSHGLLIKLVI